jgi:SAM-dependent methyltransferase
MTRTFGAAYASIYDAMYAEKDYRREVDVIVDAFVRHADGTPPGGGVRTVLDLGCGTGNHALLLAARGYSVTGVDLSPQMLAIAREKADGAAADICFVAGDVRYVDAHGPYDAALLMFAVLGYQHANADVRATFSNIRRHLRPGGLLIFDAWYGPGVLADAPADRTRVVETMRGAVERRASSEMDVRHHLCTVRYHLTPAADCDAEAAVETHVVLYFFPMELEMYLESCGFRLLRMTDAADPEREPDERTWNVHVVAQAV